VARFRQRTASILDYAGIAVTVDPFPIRSSRLELVLFTKEFEQALLAGDRAAAQEIAGFALPEDFCADKESHEFMKWKRAQIEDDPSFAAWSLRAVVLRSSRIAIGTTNFHGPPGINDTSTPRAAEVGYTILVAHRDLGFATEVARAMISWAQREHGVSHFISGVAPTNPPSLRVNEKLGFVPTGDLVDGELIFELRT
jgi:ribosomal-protein-alanine N-acetyltransferase